MTHSFPTRRSSDLLPSARDPCTRVRKCGLSSGAPPVRSTVCTPGASASSSRLRATVATCMIRSEEHTSELQSLMRISYAVFCLQKKQQLVDDLGTFEQPPRAQDHTSQVRMD